MRAILLERPGRMSSEGTFDGLREAELERPRPGPGQISIKVRACGVCHTDLHQAEGELQPHKLPVVPGHQIVGEVSEKGRGSGRFEVGDRVGVAWLNWTCGECAYCRRGLENLCEKARFTGYDADGGYAEYVVVDERFAYPLPEGLDDAQAAPLLCAGIIGYRALRLSEVQPGGTLGLFGFGASAHIAIQIARHWGCEVYVFTRSREHMELAERLGAAWTGTSEQTPPRKLTNAVIFAPAGRIVHDALKSLEKGGTAAINAIYMSPIPQMDYSLIYGERTLRSVTASTRRDAEELLKLAAKIPIRTEVETFELSEAERALRALKGSEIRGAGVLLV